MGRAKLSATTSLSITALSKFIQTAVTFPASYVGDRWGATSTMLAGGAATALAIIPSMSLLMWIVQNSVGETSSALNSASLEPVESLSPPPHVIACAFLVLGVLLPILITFYLVPSNLYMTSLFETGHRGKGAGLGLGLASIVGGLTPMISTTLAEKAAWLPGLFVTCLVIPSLSALCWSRVAAQRGWLGVYQRACLF